MERDLVVSEMCKLPHHLQTIRPVWTSEHGYQLPSITKYVPPFKELEEDAAWEYDQDDEVDQFDCESRVKFRRVPAMEAGVKL